MKKLIISAGIALAVAIAAFNVNLSTTENKNRLSFDNVEALAARESSGGWCYAYGTLDCAGVDIRVYYIVE